MAEWVHEQRPDVLLVKERHLVAGYELSNHVESNADVINNFLRGTFTHDTIILSVILN